MKAFEKWNKSNSVCSAFSGIIQTIAERHREMAWKAALEWVLKEAIASGCVDDVSCNITRGIINKELEDESI